MLMPQACSATDSRSADRRPNADQQADEQRDRDRDGERLRHQRHQDPRDDLPRDAFGDELLAVVRERLNQQEEREDEQPDAGRAGGVPG